MQMILLTVACVLLTVWGVGSTMHALTHAAGAWMTFAPRAAAALIFTGMLFGPARTHQPCDEQELSESASFTRREK